MSPSAKYFGRCHAKTRVWAWINDPEILTIVQRAIDPKPDRRCCIFRNMTVALFAEHKLAGTRKSTGSEVP